MKPIMERDDKGHLTHARLSDGTEWDQEGDAEEEDE